MFSVQIAGASARWMHLSLGARMSLRVVCCYSLLTGPDGWQDSHRCVRQFVNALKSRPLSGYGYVRLFPDSPRLRIDGSNAHEAVGWFGAMAADILQRELPGTAPVLVPVPDSRRISTSPASLTRPLAEAISSCIAGTTVLDVLCFDQVMHSAHGAQGARDALSLHLHLKLRGLLLTGRPTYWSMTWSRLAGTWLPHEPCSGSMAQRS